MRTGLRHQLRRGHLYERDELPLRELPYVRFDVHRGLPVTPLQSLLTGKRVCVLTGAGVSTDSGIPDYRGPTAPPRRRNPIQHREFVEQPLMRSRYWARSMLGWPRFRDFQPNQTHRALAQWSAVTGIITQNVDGLHQKAGAREVLELHGALRDVRCLRCSRRHDRDALQVQLERDNAGMLAHSVTLFADGDADVPDEVVRDFVVPACECGGVLKPDVVFFGDSVPASRLELCFAMLDRSEALLVLGSSLTVFSGYRFVLRAKERGLPVAIVNLGPTRADALADVKVDAPMINAIAQFPEIRSQV